MSEEKKDIVSSETQSIITLDERHAKIVMNNVDVLTNSFKTWLQEGVDYTRELYGKSEKPSLLDPGAHKIASFFHSYPEPKIIQQTEDLEPGKERIKYVARADIIHYSGVRIGSGIGSCTTDEEKYQYRWLTADRLRDRGYTEIQISVLPKREKVASRGGRFTLYRIRNPEILDLDNTILKMASKRAEVDATLSLPGVSGVFTQDIDQYPDALIDNEPRKQVEAEAKPVETQKGTATTKPAEPTKSKDEETPKLDPRATEAEETVKSMLEANDLTTKGFLITVYGKLIYVNPPENQTQDDWNDYNKVLGYIQGTWNQNSHRWEVPKP